MKARRLALMIIAAVFLSSATAVVSGRSAFAACGGANQPPCAEKEKRPTATDVPPTDTPTSVPPAAACGTPDANQLQLLCAGLPPAQGGGDPNSGGQSLPKPPNPNVPTAPTLLGPISLSGILIGLLTGILIGLLMPAALRGFSWGASGVGGIIGPSDNWHKAAGGSPGPVDAKMQKLEGGIIGPVDSWQKVNGGIVTPTDSHSQWKKFKKFSDKPGSEDGVSEEVPGPPS